MGHADGKMNPPYRAFVFTSFKITVIQANTGIRKKKHSYAKVKLLLCLTKYRTMKLYGGVKA